MFLLIEAICGINDDSFIISQQASTAIDLLKKMKNHFEKYSTNVPKFEFLRWSCDYLIETLGCYVGEKTSCNIVSASVSGIQLFINSAMAVSTCNIYSLVKAGVNILHTIFNSISHLHRNLGSYSKCIPSVIKFISKKKAG